MLRAALVGQLKDTEKKWKPYSGRPISIAQVPVQLAGVALYNEGFLILTGAWDMTEHGGGNEYMEEGGYGALVPTYPSHGLILGSAISASAPAIFWFSLLR